MSSTRGSGTISGSLSDCDSLTCVIVGEGQGGRGGGKEEEKRGERESEREKGKGGSTDQKSCHECLKY